MLSADITLLPDFPLVGDDELVRRLLEEGIVRFRDVARRVRNLPYGRNRDRADFRLVLEEGRGTCSTKHALLAHVGRVHAAPVELILGIYAMNGRNTPLAGAVLHNHRLEWIPEAHCYLRHGSVRVDLTGGTPGEPIDGFLHEETIAPEQTGDYKVALHRRFLAAWLEREGLSGRFSPEEAWQIRERCIAALTNRGEA